MEKGPVGRESQQGKKGPVRKGPVVKWYPVRVNQWARRSNEGQESVIGAGLMEEETRI